MIQAEPSHSARVVIRDAMSRHWLTFGPPRSISVGWLHADVPAALTDALATAAREGLWVVITLSYEAAPAFDPALTVRPERPSESAPFPLVWCALFEEPAIHQSLPDDSPGAAEQTKGGPGAGTPLWEPTVSPSEYADSIRTIRDLIAAGHTYQVNYSYRLRATVEDEPWALFRRMIEVQDAAYGAFISTDDWAVCSASPELFFSRADGILESRPMKGTAPRGLWYEDDLGKAVTLASSPKDRAENVMIVDMVRNDLGRIATVGTVEVAELFALEKYPTVWQMTSTVRCRSEAGVAEILRALFPAASITGAPKAKTMEIIAATESTPRRIYTGSIGFVSPEGRAQFNVAIRTLLVDRRTRTGEYGVGGGIVWDSKNEAELDECRTKARVLTTSRPKFDLLETLRWSRREGYHLLPAHLQRLERSAEYFSFSCVMGEIMARLEDEADLLVRAARAGESTDLWKVRLALSLDGRLEIAHSPLLPAAGPVRVCAAAWPVSSTDPFLYHKTTCRSVYELALASRSGFEDVILWNERGEATESTIANLVVEIDGGLFTPPVGCGLLPGVFRGHLLEAGIAQERVVALGELDDCEAVYLAGSVRGLRRIDYHAEAGR